MERAVAVKRLHKMLGKNFGYEIDPKAASAEERAAAQAVQKPLHAARDAVVTELRARMEYLLEHDAHYQKLKGEAAIARKAVEANSAILMRHKITVGTVNGMFFSVAAQGDSWEQIFEILKKNGKGV